MLLSFGAAVFGITAAAFNSRWGVRTPQLLAPLQTLTAATPESLLFHLALPAALVLLAAAQLPDDFS